MLQRLKRPVFHCRRLNKEDAGYQRGAEIFEPPVKRWLNVRSISGELTIVTGGELNTRNLIAKLTGPCPYREGDRCYIHVLPPAEHDPICSGADYRIVSVLPIHSITEIVFEKMMGGVPLAQL